MTENTAANKDPIDALADGDEIFVDDLSASSATKQFTPLQMSTYVGTKNLSNIADAGTSADNIGLGTGDSVTFTDVSVSGGMLNLGSPTELTIASGVITITQSNHTVDTEADASTDDLDTINGGTEGDILHLSAINSARTIVVKNNTGNLQIGADFSMDNVLDTISLRFASGLWLKVSSSSNGA